MDETETLELMRRLVARVEYACDRVDALHETVNRLASERLSDHEAVRHAGCPIRRAIETETERAMAVRLRANGGDHGDPHAT